MFHPGSGRGLERTQVTVVSEASVRLKAAPCSFSPLRKQSSHGMIYLERMAVCSSVQSPPSTPRVPGEAKLLNISLCDKGLLSGYAGYEMIAIFTHRCRFTGIKGRP
jgi:hypothetical protein